MSAGLPAPGAGDRGHAGTSVSRAPRSHFLSEPRPSRAGRGHRALRKSSPLSWEETNPSTFGTFRKPRRKPAQEPTAAQAVYAVHGAPRRQAPCAPHWRPPHAGPLHHLHLHGDPGLSGGAGDGCQGQPRGGQPQPTLQVGAWTAWEPSRGRQLAQRHQGKQEQVVQEDNRPAGNRRP